MEPVPIEAYSALLKRRESGVRDLPPMPGPVEGHAFRALLEASDVDRIFLWFEFRRHTKGETAKLMDALPEDMLGLERVKAFIEDDAVKGRAPVDLRTAEGLEPMLVTNDPERGPLYAIDGNHRLAAQFLTGKGFDGVAVYVCAHPKVLEWPYMTPAAREWDGRLR